MVSIHLRCCHNMKLITQKKSLAYYYNFFLTSTNRLKYLAWKEFRRVGGGGEGGRDRGYLYCGRTSASQSEPLHHNLLFLNFRFSVAFIYLPRFTGDWTSVFSSVIFSISFHPSQFYGMSHYGMSRLGTSRYRVSIYKLSLQSHWKCPRFTKRSSIRP